MKITIKTLDSMNHEFTVQDDLTVKKFKEQIAPEVNVPAESQRLIYCGRVLVDEKKLAEYDVHGKVIHLVQRAPPSSNTSDNGNSGGEGRTTTSRNITWRPLSQAVRLDAANGNAMYLGAMAFPADLMDAQGISMPQPRHGLSQSRLAVVRMMLRRARQILHNLENPTQQESPSDYNVMNVINNIEFTLTVSPSGPSSARNNPGSPQRATSGTRPRIDAILVAQAVSDAVNRATGNIVPPPVINIEVAARRVDIGDMPQTQEEPAPDSSASSSPEELLTSSSGLCEATPTPVAAEDAVPPVVNVSNTSETTNGPDVSSTENTANTNGNSSNRSRQTGTSILADLIHQVRAINRRLQPSLDRYHDLMRDDPVLENPAESQRLFNQVSELMHFMSHAYHAISDVICDFNQQPPRVLRCRPVLIQHSAVLQTGFPIQLNLSGSNQSGSQSRGTATTNTSENGRGTEAARATTGSENAGTASTTENQNITSNGTGEGENIGTGGPTSERGEQDPTSDGHVAAEPEFVHDFMQVLADMSQAIDGLSSQLVSQTASAVTSAQANDLANTSSERQPDDSEIGARSAGGNEASSSQSNSDQQQNEDSVNIGFSRFAADRGWTAQGLPSAATISFGPNWSANEERGEPQNTTPGMQSSGAGGPNIEQVWSSTETWPTTSTNTRSTTRPHVHISPGFQGMGVPGFFDPFLPCNSHHIRSLRRRALGQTEQAPVSQASTTTSTANTESTTSNTATANTNSNSNNAANTQDRSGVISEEGYRQRREEFIGRLTRMMEEEGRQNISRNVRMVQGERFNNLDNTIVFHIPNRRAFPRLTPFLRIVQNTIENRDSQNLLSELITTIARNIRLLDFWTADTRQILTSLRPVLMQFVLETLLRGETGDEAIADGVNRFITDTRHSFTLFQEWFQSLRLRDDNIDIVATFNQLHQATIPTLINDILEEVESGYLRNLPIHLREYAQNLVSIIEHLCPPVAVEASRDFLESAFNALGSVILVNIPGVNSSARLRMVRDLRVFSSSITPSSASIQRFVVRTGSDGSAPQPTSSTTSTGAPAFLEILIPSSSRTVPPAPPTQQTTPPPPYPVPPVAAPQPPPPAQPMEVDVPFVEVEDHFVEAEAATAQIAEPLPDVVIGAEQWHNHVPPDWVPIITRDRERQRRQAAQGPLSEGYLSGMPSKRRKVVSSSKPHSNLARVISESMTTAMGAAGVSPVESVVENAGTDTMLRTAYKEQVRTTVEARLRTHPDYKPEKYPNAAKLFGPK